MPSLADFERDYWAPDREQVLADLRAGTWNGPAAQAPAVLPAAPVDAWGGGGYQSPGQSVGGYNDGKMPLPTQGGGGGYGGGGGFDETAISNAWLQSGGRTLEDWKRFVAAHPEIQPYVTGSKGDKLQLPGGRVIDAVYASGEGGRGAQWLAEGGGGGGGYGGSYGGASVGQAPNATPFNYERFNAPEAFQGPDPFSYQAFQAPDRLTMENDPGYQARLALGTDAIEKSAAARGTLLTGGTLKDLNQFAQDYGSNEFQNVYNRAFQGHAQNYNQAFQDWNTNYQNQLGAYQTNYSNALDAYRTNFDTQFQPWQANYNNAYNSWQGNMNQAQLGFLNSQAAQQQRYGQLFGAAQLGLQGTNALAGAGQQYGNNMANIATGQGNQQSDLITGQGNVNAAGQIAAGNAGANALSGIGNTATMAGMYNSLYGRQTQPPLGSPNSGGAYGVPYTGLERMPRRT